MPKYIILMRPRGAVDHAEFASYCSGVARRIAADARISHLWITHTVGPPPRAIMPFRSGPVCCISMKTGVDPPGPPVDAGVLGLPEVDGIFEAEEALPVRYERDWPDGSETPGVCLLTLFHRRPSVDYATFISRWHDGHTPLSLRLHPLWHYNRNVVRALVAAEANPPYDGIVEEHFRTRADLLNPFRFYGRPHVILFNMVRVLIDILGFIDLRRIETYLVRETIIKSPPVT